ncbi:MAG: 1-deoxy-D-xylulose-5-phosphate synthase [Candidatus Delongbacteria bacterium]|nr:1-deoxy-D-xylulose-5-phosphate synthase [Candidatus Delongbacteria bacterium]MBN2836760.1 1-deoxy-D-xylulose-5-phosphate synthase [Candidatus Delongbacteria bacterium]
MKILDKIDSPQSLKTLTIEELNSLSEEIRQFILENVHITGGHLGSSLGTVELTVALHRVFKSPEDKIVWDVGHQAYAHKILTGRRDQFHTNRCYGGISGFVKPSESSHDSFGVGHASTSISAGLGYVCARDILGEDFNVISIIGDGSITGGLAYEGLNNAGGLHKKFLVILNDNKMSISKNVGAISRYLSSIYTDQTFNKIKDEVWDFAGKFKFGDTIRKAVSKGSKSVKALIAPGLLFENLGFNYIGPINGHDLEHLIPLLEDIRDNLKGPVFLHVITEKGKGFKPAEDDTLQKLHGVGPGAVYPEEKSKPFKIIPKYQDVFGETLVRLAEKDKRVIAITAAMKDGTGLNNFAEKFPDRFFDVGIAEGHAVTFAAAMSMKGLKPFVTIYSTFMQRAFDHIIHDCAIQELDMVFAMDRAGLVGEDGPTHHGTFDMSFMRIIPNLIIMAPADEDELADMMFTATKEKGLFSIRYPRGAGMNKPVKEVSELIEIGKSIRVFDGNKIAILAIGKMVEHSIKAIELLKGCDITPALYNMRFIKPLDTKQIDEIMSKFDIIITIEENNLPGGFGSAVLEYTNSKKYSGAVHRIGIPDKFVTHGNIDLLYKEIGLDSQSLKDKIEEIDKSVKH